MKLYAVCSLEEEYTLGASLYLKFDNARVAFDELVAYCGGRAREVHIEDDGEAREWWSEGQSVGARLQVMETMD